MAKKRKKNSNKKIIELLDLIIVLTGVAASVLFMFKAFEIDLGLFGKSAVEGFKIAFGDKDSNLKFDFMIAIAILLPAAGAVVSFVLKSKLSTLIAILAVVVHAILIFTLKIQLTTNISISLHLATLGYIAFGLAVIEAIAAGYKYYLS